MAQNASTKNFRITIDSRKISKTAELESEPTTHRFTPGQYLNGSLFASSNNIAKTVKLHCEGIGSTQWRSMGLADQAPFSKHRNVFLHEIQEFSFTKDSVLCAKECFKFQFFLPDDLPPSFEGKHGFIRYRLRLRISHYKSIKVPFQIVPPELDVDSDLFLDDGDESFKPNEPKSLLAPFSGFQRIQQDLLGCLPGGNRSVHAEIDRRIYDLNGDAFRLSAAFCNDTSRTCRPTVKLVQRQIFYGKGLIARTLKQSLTQLLLSPAADLRPLQPYERRIWNQVLCTLPAVATSFRSDVIDVDYFIEVTLTDKVALSENPLVSLGVHIANSRNLLRQCLATQPMLATSARIPSDASSEIFELTSSQAHNVVKIGQLTYEMTSNQQLTVKDTAVMDQQRFDEAFQRDKNRRGSSSLSTIPEHCQTSQDDVFATQQIPNQLPSDRVAKRKIR